MLQESCAISYMLEMLGSTMKENLIHQILSLVQLNQLLFHSCKIWVLNYLIIGWKLSDSPCSGTSIIKRSILLYTLMIFIIALHKHSVGCLLCCTCRVLYAIFLSKSGIS